MRKFFLCALLGIGVSAIHAESFTDLYKVTHNGRELANGDVIEISNAVMDPEYGDYTFESADIEVENRGAGIRALQGSLMASVPETSAELKQRGETRFCYENSPEIGGSCLMYTGINPVLLGVGTVNVGGAGWVADNTPGFVAGKGFTWQIHYEMVLNPAEVTELKLVMTACDGTASNSELRSEEMTVVLRFSTELSQVGEVWQADREPAEYYTLDGLRVSEPVNGIYLEKRGGKVTKRIKH